MMQKAPASSMSLSSIANLGKIGQVHDRWASGREGVGRLFSPDAPLQDTVKI